MPTIYTWSDVDAEFAKDTSGDIKKSTDVDAIINSLRNILGTDQGTRRMLQRFASNVKSLLFEPMDQTSARFLGQRVLESIRYWDDRINIDGIDIQPDYEHNLYRCRCRFTIVDSDIEESIDFILSR